uniref:DNA helicase Pif1-like 2B domain-containing protein n=1 Tax=Arundo donax TaxID=35708 RepID=A0A0A9BGD7_ARUDO
MSDPNYMTSKAILLTWNDCVDMINIKISRFQGDEMVYHSFDCAVDDPHNYYLSEFLNSLTPNGLPPHILKLNISCPIILLRNRYQAGAPSIKKCHRCRDCRRVAC